MIPKMFKILLLSAVVFLISGCYKKEDVYTEACKHLKSIAENIDKHQKMRNSCIDVVTKSSRPESVSEGINKCISFAEEIYPVNKSSYLIGKNWDYSPEDAYRDAFKNGCGNKSAVPTEL